MSYGREILVFRAIAELQLSHHELVWSIALWIEKEENSSRDEQKPEKILHLPLRAGWGLWNHTRVAERSCQESDCSCSFLWAGASLSLLASSWPHYWSWNILRFSKHGINDWVHPKQQSDAHHHRCWGNDLAPSHNSITDNPTSFSKILDDDLDGPDMSCFRQVLRKTMLSLFFYWSIVDTHCCANFYWTAKWFSYT